MTLSIEIWTRFWPYHEPFALSRGVALGEDTIQIRVRDEDGHCGRGEAVGITYAGETPASMQAQIESMRTGIEAGISREDLLTLLPKGGARMAVDAALWDIEAKRSGVSPFRVAGLKAEAVTSVCSIGIKTLGGYTITAAQLANYPMIKVKVDGRDPLASIAAVKRGAPGAKLIIDPNQAWSIDQLKALAPLLPALDVVLLEQPIAVGDEPGLDGWTAPVPLCADELIAGVADLERARGRFDVINIKLDKSGGLTAALTLAEAVEAQGFGLMVGCMMGSSLSMAPAMVLAQRARFVDLDGPLLHSEDVEFGFAYVNGRIEKPHEPKLWG